MTDIDNLEDENKLTDRLIEAVTKLSPQRKKMLEELLKEWERLDYREDSRIPCFLPVDYSAADRVYQDFINNLSNGGVLRCRPCKNHLKFPGPSSERNKMVSGLNSPKN